ncbi:hypothetical protein FVE85_7260 [Porphyridium purpureum]|uniref:Uncharacterized protein n=1 Tax=Porphyridium purpureum TaxID=35688 RepID=A0A5J4Z8M7_PORPP|nr:hypothetical protein FVE85_7260 [Porphyridium purpureum]|eukprot:POR3351..scf295_1
MWILLSCESPVGATLDGVFSVSEKKKRGVWGRAAERGAAPASRLGGELSPLRVQLHGEQAERKMALNSPVKIQTGSAGSSARAVLSPSRLSPHDPKAGPGWKHASAPLNSKSSQRMVGSPSSPYLHSTSPQPGDSTPGTRNASTTTSLKTSGRSAPRTDRVREKNQLVAQIDCAVAGTRSLSANSGHPSFGSRRNSGSSANLSMDRIHSNENHPKRQLSSSALVLPEITGMLNFTSASLRVIIKTDDMPNRFFACPLNEYLEEKGDMYGAPTELYMCEVPVEKSRSIWVDFVSTKTNLHVTVLVDLKEMGQRVELPPQTGFASLVVDEVMKTPVACRLGVRVNEVYCAEKSRVYPVLSYKVFLRAPDAVWLTLYASEQLLTPESRNKEGSHPRYLFKSISMNLPRRSGQEIMLCLYRHGKQRSQRLVGSSKFVLEKVQCTAKRPRVRSEVPMLLASAKVGTLTVECSEGCGPSLLSLGLSVQYAASEGMHAARKV